MSASATSTAINVKNSGKSQLSRFCSEKQLIPKESKLPLFMYMMACTYIYINIITPKYLSAGEHASSCWCSLPTSKGFNFQQGSYLSIGIRECQWYTFRQLVDDVWQSIINLPPFVTVSPESSSLCFNSFPASFRRSLSSAPSRKNPMTLERKWCFFGAPNMVGKYMMYMSSPALCVAPSTYHWLVQTFPALNLNLLEEKINSEVSPTQRETEISTLNVPRHFIEKWCL